MAFKPYYKASDGSTKELELKVKWSNIEGKPTIPTVPTKTSQLTNDSGYIAGITKSMVTTALGYTPPTSDTNTTYSAGTGLSLSGTTFNHSNSVTAVTTAGLYKVKYDAQGHITGTSAITKSDITGLGIPSSDTNTWRPLGTTADTACAGNDSRLSNSRPASDVYAWAKASSKPTYNWSEITQSGANSLEEGTSDVTDNTEILTSYASNNGFADTNAQGKVYRRDAVKIYNYVKGKLDSVYQPKGSYLTSQSLSGYATQTWVNSNLADYATVNYVNQVVSNAGGGGSLYQHHIYMWCRGSALDAEATISFTLISQASDPMTLSEIYQQYGPGDDTFEVPAAVSVVSRDMSGTPWVGVAEQMVYLNYDSLFISMYARVFGNRLGDFIYELNFYDGEIFMSDYITVIQ